MPKPSLSVESELEAFLKTHDPVRLPSVFTSGEQVGDWRILALIARGGCGEVYRVEHVRTGAVAALKVLFKDDAALRTRFILESDILQRMASYVGRGTSAFPHFLERGAVRAGACPYVVIEELKDFDLPETDAAVAAFLLKMCTALSELHANGYLHRDLKPANIMCRADGEPVIIDFGLALHISDLEQNPLAARVSRTDGLLKGVGTIGSSAPEQAAGEATVRSDVYSLGALANDCFRGNPPAAWSSIIRKALDPKPEYRYASPAELAEAIRQRPRGRLWKRVACGVVLFGALAGAVAGVVAGGRNRDRPAPAPVPAPVAPTVKTAAETPENLQLLNEGWDLLCGVNGKTKDNVAAADCFRRAAEAGSVRGQIEYAKGYLHGRGGMLCDQEKAWRIFNELADRDVEALRMVGICQSYGHGTPQDRAAGAETLRRAAERGSAHAFYNLSQCYRRGGGVPQDSVEADRMLQAAATNGYVRGMVEWYMRSPRREESLHLLEAAVRARITEPDEKPSVRIAWESLGLKLAGKRVLTPAERAQLEECGRKGMEYGDNNGRSQWLYGVGLLEKDPKKAEQQLKEAFYHGYRVASFDLFELKFAAGAAARRERDHWYRIVCESFRSGASCGVAESCWKLGFVLVQQREDSFSIEEGIRYLERAGDKGEVAGYVEAGNALIIGDGSAAAPDYARACELYRKAVDKGNPRGCYGLGVCYRYGLGVAKDEAKAFELFERGRADGLMTAKVGLADLVLQRGSPRFDARRGVALVREVLDDDGKDEAGVNAPIGSEERHLARANATYLLACCYWHGEGVGQDRTRARELFKQASARCTEAKWACDALAAGREPKLEGLLYERTPSTQP